MLVDSVQSEVEDGVLYFIGAGVKDLFFPSLADRVSLGEVFLLNEKGDLRSIAVPIICLDGVTSNIHNPVLENVITHSKVVIFVFFQLKQV